VDGRRARGVRAGSRIASTGIGGVIWKAQAGTAQSSDGRTGAGAVAGSGAVGGEQPGPGQGRGISSAGGGTGLTGRVSPGAGCCGAVCGGEPCCGCMVT
jgi:hypothetical protein